MNSLKITRELLMATAVAAALLAATSSAHAQVNMWTGTASTNWFDDGNWTLLAPNGRTNTLRNNVNINPPTGTNAPVIAMPGAEAIGVNIANNPGSTGMLTIENGG